MILLQIDGLPARCRTGRLLRWVCELGDINSRIVGRILINAPSATIEIKLDTGAALARALHGQRLDGRQLEVWWQAAEHRPQAFFRNFLAMLKREAAAEPSEDSDDAKSLPELLVRESWLGLGGRVHLLLARHGDKSLPERPRPGNPITLSNGSSKLHGLVCASTPTQVEVAVAEFANPETTWTLTPAANNIASARAERAMRRADAATDGRLCELRHVLLGEAAPRFAPVESPRTPQLNESQQAALRFANSAQDLAVIHGPPGTGKTTVVAAIIADAVARGERVLACAPSNLAVDNILERLVEAGIGALRIGHPARVDVDLQQHTLDGQVLRHRDSRRVRQLGVQAAAAERQGKRDEAAELMAEAAELEQSIVTHLLDHSPVVCATLTGLDTIFLGARRYGLAIVDEACQAIEPSCWLPVLRAERLVLAGDHCQLPPTVLSQERRLHVSMLERLIDTHGPAITSVLQRQYRMHADIMAFSNAQFYEGQLIADDSVADATLPGDSEALTFVDTSGAGYDEEREPDGPSLRNPQEAGLVVQLVELLLKRGIEPDAIAILSPYAAQVRLLQEQMPEIESCSIDGYQGRECDIIILTLVRSNPERTLGFLRDTRRMNVAMTRARRKLIVIGDSATFGEDPFYSAFLDHVDSLGAYHWGIDDLD
jgi:ATP-dependent RNA/DNA helicase IGHMBP2